jgi:GNAT superfamily N-acetyltransferase
MTQAEITLPPGCLLRQANSSDRLEFKQLQRQNAINSFPQFLVFGLGLTLVLILLLFFTLGIVGLFFPLKITYSPILLALGAVWLALISGFFLGLFTNKFFLDLSNTWLIRCQGRLVAWVTLRRNTKGSLIQVLFVEKTWRRRGLGSALVKRLIQEASPPLSVGCPPNLVRFYSRLGFVRYGSNIFGGQLMVYKGFDLNPRHNQP